MEIADVEREAASAEAGVNLLDEINPRPGLRKIGLIRGNKNRETIRFVFA